MAALCTRVSAACCFLPPSYILGKKSFNILTMKCKQTIPTYGPGHKRISQHSHVCKLLPLPLLLFPSLSTPLLPRRRVNKETLELPLKSASSVTTLSRKKETVVFEGCLCMSRNIPDMALVFFALWAAAREVWSGLLRLHTAQELGHHVHIVLTWNKTKLCPSKPSLLRAILTHSYLFLDNSVHDIVRL